MSWHPATGFVCDGCGCPRPSDSECDPCSTKRTNEFWETTRKRAAEYERRQRMPEEHARYRTALERIARLEDFVDAHHAPAIAREALKETK